MADQETIDILKEIRDAVLSKHAKDRRSGQSLYQCAGITDIREFYRTRYTSGGILNPRYFDPINRYDIRWARTMWAFDNIRHGSVVLDAGCRAGLLSLLKRRNVRLVGIDVSKECCEEAIRNGYDAAVVGDLRKLPFPDGLFDYVVSFDVMGHIEVRDKDEVIAEFKRVLKHVGETLHGIECLDRSKRRSYDQMTDHELREYVQVDGHVGMEDPDEIKDSFARRFSFVQTRPGFSICQPAEEFIKQADEYGLPICEPDFLRYVNSLGASERRAFNVAMGYVFSRIAEDDVRIPPSEYLFLKASETETIDFYNSHRSRAAFRPGLLQSGHFNSVALDRFPNASFEAGWYPPEELPPVARWMGRYSVLTFHAESYTGLRLELTTHIPDLHRNPLQIEFMLNKENVLSMTLIGNGWVEVQLPSASATGQQNADRTSLLEIVASRTWVPGLYNSSSDDEREMSIAVCNIELTF